MYGHIRCICAVLANPTRVVSFSLSHIQWTTEATTKVALFVTYVLVCVCVCVCACVRACVRACVGVGVHV